MAEKYKATNKVMTMTLKQLAELERLWVTAHYNLKILDRYIEEDGKQFKLNEAENIIELREKIGEAIIITRTKIRRFNGNTLQ